NARQGTSATKTRGDVSGAGRKLWKQKGTGRARIASLRSPLWKGGGNVHGPQPRDWSYNMPKKMRQGALRSALSERVREGNVFVVEGWTRQTEDERVRAVVVDARTRRQDADCRFTRQRKPLVVGAQPAPRESREQFWSEHLRPALSRSTSALARRGE